MTPANLPASQQTVAACHRALTPMPQFAGLSLDALTPWPTKGISHDHIAIAGHDLLLRIPRFSQWGIAPAQHLAYERAAFRRAAGSTHVPALLATLPVSSDLPAGALLVQRIQGRPPRLPEDLAAIAAALAALHARPVPPPSGRAPLISQTRPVTATLAAIEAQAADLPAAGLAAEADAALRDELAWARTAAAAENEDFPVLAFVGTDTHPGNFLIDADGKAWFLDLEKSLYGAPPIDLAHATLPTSVGWDPDCAGGGLDAAHIADFYATYLAAIGADRTRRLAPWLLPMRRLTWLRTMTWFVRWRARWSNQAEAARQTAAVTAHIDRHIAASFEPAAIAAARREWLGPDPLHLPN